MKINGFVFCSVVFILLSCARGGLDTGEKKNARERFQNSDFSSYGLVEKLVHSGYQFYYGKSKKLQVSFLVDEKKQKVIQIIADMTDQGATRSQIFEEQTSTSCQSVTLSDVLKSKSCGKAVCYEMAEHLYSRHESWDQDYVNEYCPYLNLYKAKQSFVSHGGGESISVENFYEKDSPLLKLKKKNLVNLQWKAMSNLNGPPPLRLPKSHQASELVYVFGKHAEQQKIVVGEYSFEKNTWQVSEVSHEENEAILHTATAQSKIFFYGANNIYSYDLKEKKWLESVSWNTFYFRDMRPKKAVSLNDKVYLSFESGVEDFLSGMIIEHDLSDSSRAAIEEIALPDPESFKYFEIEPFNQQLTLWTKPAAGGQKTYLLNGLSFQQVKRDKIYGLPIKFNQKRAFLGRYVVEGGMQTKIYDLSEQEKLVQFSDAPTAGYQNPLLAEDTMIYGLTKKGQQGLEHYSPGYLFRIKSKDFVYLTPNSSSPSKRSNEVRIWDGKRLLIWGGCAGFDLPDETDFDDENSKTGEACESFLNDGKILTIP